MPDPFQMISADAAAALTEFSSQFDEALALGAVDNWAERLGLLNSSTMIQTIYPLPISAAGYVERTGDDKLRDMYEASIRMRTKEWVDGVKILARIVEAPDFVGWATEPQRIAHEAARQSNVLVATMLNANAYLDLYRQELDGADVASSIELFSASHKVNIYETSYGTFDNTSAVTGINATTHKAIALKFRQREGPNGKPMGLVYNTLLVPAALEDQAKDFYSRDQLIEVVQNVGATENVAAAANTNRFSGTVEVVVAPELDENSTTVCYAIDRNSAAKPWIIQNGGGPEEIRYDKTSDMYKDSGFIAVKYVIQAAAAGALPHAIEQVTVS